MVEEVLLLLLLLLLPQLLCWVVGASSESRFLTLLCLVFSLSLSLSLSLSPSTPHQPTHTLSSSSQIRNNDLAIHALLSRFCRDPIMCIVDVRPHATPKSPTTAYKVELVPSSSSSSSSTIVPTFRHLPSAVGALEAEEVGVEHLLRDVNDPTASTLAKAIGFKTDGLETLRDRLRDIRIYLDGLSDKCKQGDNKDVLAATVARRVLDGVQGVANLMPNVEGFLAGGLQAPEDQLGAAATNNMHQAIVSKTNDMHVSMYLASLVRAVVAVDDLARNRFEEKRREELADAEKEKALGGDSKGEEKKGDDDKSSDKK